MLLGNYDPGHYSSRLPLNYRNESQYWALGGPELPLLSIHLHYSVITTVLYPELSRRIVYKYHYKTCINQISASISGLLGKINEI